MPDEETQELPVAEANDVEPPADLGPWGAEAVRLGVDAEPTPLRASANANSPRPIRRRWTTAGTLGIAALLIGALVVTSLPPNPGNDSTSRPPTPRSKRDVASAPRTAAPPKPSPRQAERDSTRTPAKTRKPRARTRTAPKPTPHPSPTYLPTPAPPPPSEPVAPSPAPAPTAEPTPTMKPPPASGPTVAKEFGFER